MRVAIHAGAFATDENHISNALMFNRRNLNRQGVAVADPEHALPKLHQRLTEHQAHSDEPTSSSKLRDELLSGLNSGRVIFSDDRLLGEPAQIVQNSQLYPAAGLRAAFFDDLFVEDEVELFFALCNPATLLPNVLKTLPLESQNDILRSTELNRLNWKTMVEDIIELAPNIRLTLWCNEDLPLIWSDLIRTIADIPAQSPIRQEFSMPASLLTETGKRHLAILLKQGLATDSSEFQMQFDSILDQHAEPDLIEVNPDYPGWTQDIIDGFTELYARDLAQIAVLPDVQMLTPRIASN